MRRLINRLTGTKYTNQSEHKPKKHSDEAQRRVNFFLCVCRRVCNVIAPVGRAQAIFQRMSLCFIGHRVLTV